MGALGTYWKYGKEFTSIEHCRKADGSDSIYTLTAIEKAGEFNIRKTFTDCSIDNIAKQLKKNQHCFLNITGSQVLIKSTIASGNESKIISSAFPNIDTNEFYYQILRTSSQSFIAICRKDYVEETLNQYNKKNLEIVGFSLGFNSIQHLLSFFSEEVIQLASYSLNTGEKEIIAFEKNEQDVQHKEYLIDETLVDSEFLLTLSGLFCYERFPEHITSNFQDKNGILKKSQHQKVFFRKGLLVGTGFLLTALLINFLLFTFYYSEFQTLNEEYQVELIQKQIVDEKVETISEKEKMVSKILNNTQSKSTFFLNRIVTSKPNSITLNEFTYQPIQGQVKERELIKLVQNQILISGESGDEQEFSSWLKSLEHITWIKQVQIANFSFKNTVETEFRIIITLATDESTK